MAVRHTFKNAAPMVTRNVDAAVLFANRVVALTKGRVYSAGRDQVLEVRRRSTPRRSAMAFFRCDALRGHVQLAWRPCHQSRRDAPSGCRGRQLPWLWQCSAGKP
jgi:hypothetical protein